MRAEIVNCFLNSITSTFQSNCNVTMKIKGQNAYENIVLRDHLGIVITTFGTSTIKGKIVIAMAHGVGRKIIANMLGLSDYSEIDDIGISALSEFANWIIGNSTREIRNHGESITNFYAEVILPEKFENQSSTVTNEFAKRFLSVNCDTDMGEVIISFSFE